MTTPQTLEIFPIVDTNGNTIGKATRQECHSGSKLLHPVVHLHIFDDNGNLFLQKRSQKKDIQPGKWDTAVGGHIDFGETVEDALFREAKEELGFTQFNPQKLFSYIFESNIEKELINSFYTSASINMITIDNDEITEGRFWSINEIKINLGKNIFTPNFEQEFTKLINFINS